MDIASHIDGPRTVVDLSKPLRNCVDRILATATFIWDGFSANLDLRPCPPSDSPVDLLCSFRNRVHESFFDMHVQIRCTHDRGIGYVLSGFNYAVRAVSGAGDDNPGKLVSPFVVHSYFNLLVGQRYRFERLLGDVSGLILPAVVPRQHMHLPRTERGHRHMHTLRDRVLVGVGTDEHLGEFGSTSLPALSQFLFSGENPSSQDKS